MDTRLSKEALLRHLLDADPKVPEDKIIYSYLLGYRLFQSPDQLLHEIQRRTVNKDSAEVSGRFQRHNNKAAAWSKGPACTKCRQKHEAPRLMSKSTNNMLDNDGSSSVYVELVRNNVMVNNVGRKQPNSFSCSDSENLSPALSTNDNLNETAKSSDFDDYCDIDGMLSENRRNTAPPASLQGVPSPRLRRESPVGQLEQMGTDFSTHKGRTYISTANIELTLENLPETNLDDVICADGVVASGEDTIRRRKKGRRRTMVTSTGDEIPIGSMDQPATLAAKLTSEMGTDRRSVASRDSGILSEVMEPGIDMEYHSNNNNNNNKKAKTGAAARETTITAPRIDSALHRNLNISVTPEPHDDSGYSSQASPASMNETPLDEVAKDIEAHVCALPSDEAPATSEAQSRQLHLLHVLLIWVRDFPSDFRKHKTIMTLNGLLKTLKNGNQELKEHCAKVTDTLSRCNEAQKSYEEKLIASDREDAAKSSEDFRKTKEAMVALVTGMSDASDACKMAEQLCLIEMDLLSHLGADEFLQMFSSKGVDDSRTNLGASVRWFNHLSHLVATTVCVCRKPKHRRHVISLFTSSAARCYELSNFNSAMAILTGLSLGAVARLKRTWSKVDTTQIDKLQAAFDPSNNFRRYRTMFKSRWAAMVSHQEAEVVKEAPAPENRYSTASQHSVTSRMSIASVTSQHRDSGIECENESAASSKSPVTSSADSTPKRQFVFDDVTSVTGIQDGVLVPFLTLMVKDVYFLNHSTPTIEQDGTINVEKLRHLGEILHPLETWKNNPCVYQKNQELQDFLLHSPVLKDTELYSLSYKREPPKNKFEKTQLKTIRAEIETSKRSHAIRRIISRRKTM